MANVNLSPKSVTDLQEIKQYISEELSSPQAAQNLINKIMESIEKLESFPHSGSLLSSIVEIDTNYRYLACDNYLVFYRCESDMVYIDRVLYGKRDYLRILFN